MPVRIDLDKLQIMSALDATGGLKGAAARMLRVSPATLRRRIREEGLHDYVWEKDQYQRLLRRYEASMVAQALNDDYESMAHVLMEVGWKENESINEPRCLSAEEVEALRAEWASMQVRDRWGRPFDVIAAASDGYIEPPLPTRRRRRASTGRHNGGRIKGTP